MIYTVSKRKHPLAQPASFSRCISYLKKQKLIAIDTETTGLDPLKERVTLIQVGTLEDQFIIDTKFLKHKHLQKLKKILEDQSISKVLTNAAFDYMMLQSNYGIRMENVIDIMLIEQLFMLGKYGLGQAYKNSSLKALAKKYLNYEFDTKQLSLFEDTVSKSTAVSFANFKKLTKEQVRYAAYDVILPLKIYEKQKPIISKLGLQGAVDLENEFVLVLGDMTLNGFKVDIPKWKLLAADVTIKRQQVEDKLLEYADINWNSSQQVIKIFNLLGISTLTKDKKTGETKQSVDRQVLESQIDQHEILPIYFEYKELVKAETAYGEGFLKYVYEDERIHPRYNQLLKTGRISGVAPNPHNIKRGSKYRSGFVAGIGNHLVCADYSQQELRVAADQSQEPEMLKVYNSVDGDMHTATTVKVFGANWEQKDPEARFKGKTINFLTIYGGGADKLSKKFLMSKSKANRLIDSFWRGYPVLQKHFKQVTSESINQGFIRTDKVTGRIARLPYYEELLFCIKEIQKAQGRNYEAYWKYLATYKRLMAKVERLCQNWPIQATSASMTKYAAILIRRYIRDNHAWNRIQIVNIVHDEIVLECRSILREKVLTLLTQCMTESGRKFAPSVPMKVGAKHSLIWEH